MTLSGLIVTNYHVVENKNEVNVITRTGLSCLGKVLTSNLSTDLAIVKIEGSGYSYAKLSDASNSQVGDEVLLFGSPLGLEWSVSKGIVSGIRDMEGTIVVQTDAAMNYGNSGGPLLHVPSNSIIGINSFKVNNIISDGLGFAIASQEIKSSIKNASNSNLIALNKLGLGPITKVNISLILTLIQMEGITVEST